MASDRQTEFRELFARFCTEYFSTSAGEKHRATYGASAESALRNLKNIRDAELAGRSTTDLVLDGLLPHLDTRSTRERGAWIHVAPAINSDVRTWYEYDGFVKPEDWKHVAKEILLFITTAYDRPAKLSHAVATFVASQYSRGFQTGMLTPVLHALRPNEFVLINGKSYAVVNYFTEASILPQIADYPRANEVTWKWLRDCEPVMRELTTDLTTPVSVIFDMFCHWMVAIAKAIEAKGRRSLRLDVTPAKPLVAPQLNRRIWSFSAGPGGSEWPLFRSEAVVAIDWAGLGDLRDYVSKDEINAKLLQLFPGPVTKLNDSHACWQFVHEMAVGDIIVAKHGRQRVLAIGEVAGEYQFVEGASSYQHRRSVKWLNIGPWTLPDSALMAVKTLTDVTDYTSFIETIRRIVHFDFGESTSLDDDDDGDHVIVSQHQAARYTIQDALEHLFMSHGQLTTILDLLAYRKNVILQGPPGVGKTFVAKRVAYALMKEKATERVEMIQFHQSYSYEDFIQGFRPQVGGGFALVNGVFFEFCRRAETDPEKDYVFIIDEINRGNLSKIFGELMMLIESDKRGADHSMPLTYSPRDRFSVPENVHILGMMNTADRSLAMVDYALRRRFAFVDLVPSFNERFEAYLRERMNAPEAIVRRIVERFESVNGEIADDRKNLGPGFRIGHSYFCNLSSGDVDETWYERIVRFEIEPLLREYWFDNEARAKSLLDQLLAQ